MHSKTAKMTKWHEKLLNRHCSAKRIANFIIEEKHANKINFIRNSKLKFDIDAWFFGRNTMYGIGDAILEHAAHHTKKKCDSPQLPRTHVFDFSSRNIEKHNFRYETLFVTINMKIWKMYLKICPKYWCSIIFVVAAPNSFEHLLLHNFFLARWARFGNVPNIVGRQVHEKSMQSVECRVWFNQNNDEITIRLNYMVPNYNYQSQNLIE